MTSSTSFPYWARALGLDGENFRSARAQNLKLVLVVVLVLQSEGRQYLFIDIYIIQAAKLHSVFPGPSSPSFISLLDKNSMAVKG